MRRSISPAAPAIKSELQIHSISRIAWRQQIVAVAAISCMPQQGLSKRLRSAFGCGSIRCQVGVRDVRHAAARAALSSSERASDDRDRLRQIDLSGAPAAAPPGASLHAAHPVGDARSRPDDSAARHAEGGARICAEARRLDRGASRPAARSRRRSPTAASCRCAACRTASCIAAAMRGTVWTEMDARRRAAALRRRPGSAHRPAHRRFPAPRSQARSARPRACRFAGELGVRDQARRRARSIEPLGLVLDDRRAVVFLAAHSGAERRCSIISPRTKWRISSR